MTHSLTLKRLAAPTTWKMKKKGVPFVVRPLPGAHSYAQGTSLVFLLRDMLGVAKTAKEAKFIIHGKDVLIDGVRRKEKKFLAGLMDTVSLVPINKHYRISFSPSGALTAVSVPPEEALRKLAKITGKKMLPGNVLQLNLSDGRSILGEKGSYACGDSLLIDLPSQKIVSHFKLEKGVTIMLTEGKHQGKIGKVEDLGQDLVSFAIDNEKYRTKKAFAFVLGQEKSVITVR